MVGNIIGNQNPVVGIIYNYELNPLGVLGSLGSDYEWHIFKKQKTGKWKEITNTPKKGNKVTYRFGEIALGIEFEIKVYEIKQGLLSGIGTSKNLIGTFSVIPTRNKAPKIDRVTLFNRGAKDSNKANYRDTLVAQAHCIALFNQEIEFHLWEDDAEGRGPNMEVNKNNRHFRTYKAKVNENGLAEVKISLMSDEKILRQIANKYMMRGDQNGGAYHEYYVTASHAGKILGASQVNVNVNNPDYKKEKPQPQKDTPKFPENPRHNKQADPKGNIIEAVFVNNEGKELSKITVGDPLRVRIHSKNMVGKHIQYVIWEKDATSNDEIYRSKMIKISGDVCDTYAIILDKDLFEKGIDLPFGDPDADQQHYFIEIISLDLSSQSVKFGVDMENGLLEVEQVRSPSIIKEKKVVKEKFEKVIGLGKEAVLYISSEIATEIKVDKNGKIISYPDYGGDNGMSEYKEGEKIYCKKLTNGKSAFPLYKLYIYRGNRIGEAIKKLKQDLENKTHQNAEPTILTVARHAQTNNKDYGTSGPLAPNTIKTLYRIRYMQAWNHKKKESFRYRIVSDSSSKTCR